MHLKLCLVLMVANTFTRKWWYSDAGECIDSGKTTLTSADYETILTPRHCIPTTCKVTTSNGTVVNGFNCTIGNGDRFPTACLNFRNALAASGRGGHGPSCPATLAKISRYVISCKESSYEAVSLNLTFDLPTCGRTISGLQDAVMAVFSARNETTDRYFTANHICRVFSFGNNDLRHFAPDESVLVQYDCIAMGLEVTTYPKALYYLTLTTFPWGDVLNYTIVYLAYASEGSMRLVAGAWLPGRRIHVVFETAWRATSYHVQAKGEQVFFSGTVPSSSPSVMIQNVPPQAHTVTVKVEPVELDIGQCPSFNGVCSPIEVTLHVGSQLNLYGRPEQVKGNDGDAEKAVVALAVVAAAVAVVTFIVVVVFKRKLCVVPGKQLRVLIGNGAPQDATVRKILAMLRKRGFTITFHNPDPCSWENTPQPAVLRSQDVILLFLHPAAQDVQRRMQGLVRAIFQMALVTKTRVVSLVDEHGDCVKPSEMFLPGLIPLNTSRSDDFVQSLDRATFYMPGEFKKLMGSLKELSRSRGSRPLGFFRRRRENGVRYDRERDGVALSASDGGETLTYSESYMEADGTISGHEHRQSTVRVEVQIHPVCDRGPSSASIGHETGSSPQVPCPVHSAAGSRTIVDRGRQRHEETGVVSDPWTYGQCGRPPLSACDTSHRPGFLQPPRSPPCFDQRCYDKSDDDLEDPRLSGQPSDTSRSPDMSIHSRDRAVLQSATDEIPHSRLTTPLLESLDHDNEVKHLDPPPSLCSAPFRGQYSIESEIPSDILSAPTLSSVLSSEPRQLPEGSEDQALPESTDDRQSQDFSEETTVKSPVPTALAQSERRDWVEGRDRLGCGQSSPQNQPEDVPESASNRSWLDVEYQQSSWPSQCRPVPEGESLPENRPDCKSRVQSHAPVVSQHAPTECSVRRSASSDLAHSATSHDSHSRRSSRTAVGESLNDQNLYDQSLNDQSLNDQRLNDQSLNDQNLYDQSLNDQSLNDQSLNDQRPVGDASQATAAGTFVPKYPPERNWTQRIDRDQRFSDELARTTTKTNSGCVARPPTNIDRPWLACDMPANSAMDSVDRLAQELFDVPQNLLSEAAGPLVANGRHSEAGAFAGAEDERSELRGAPPGVGMCGDFHQMNGPVNGHGNLGPVNGHGNLGPVNGHGNLGPVNEHGNLGPVNGHGNLWPVNGHGILGPVNEHGNLGPVNGHGNLGPVNGHGNLGWRQEGLREVVLACRRDPVENGESSSDQWSAGSVWNGSSRNGGVEEGQDGPGELGHLGYARPEPVEDTESSSENKSSS